MLQKAQMLSNKLTLSHNQRSVILLPYFLNSRLQTGHPIRLMTPLAHTDIELPALERISERCLEIAQTNRLLRRSGTTAEGTGETRPGAGSMAGQRMHPDVRASVGPEAVLSLDYFRGTRDVIAVPDDARITNSPVNSECTGGSVGSSILCIIVRKAR